MSSAPGSVMDSQPLSLHDLIEKITDRENDEATSVRLLTSLADWIEKDFESFTKQDPDPLDERHPAKIIEKNPYGETLKIIARDTEFLDHLIDFCFDGIKSLDIHVAAARILMGVMPGFESNYLLQHKSILEISFRILINNEYAEPLHSYIINILGYTTFSDDILDDFKLQFAQVFPLVLQKLSGLIKELENTDDTVPSTLLNSSQNTSQCSILTNGDVSNGCLSVEKAPSDDGHEPQPKRRRISLPCPSPAQVFNDCSNSSWAEMEQYQIGSCKFYPLTNQISQRCIMWFLNQLVRNEQYLQDIYKYDLLKMLNQSINLDFHNDVRLSLEALRTLSMLFYNRKCAFDFYQRYTLKPILSVYRQSVASNGVSNCLRMIFLYDDLLQRICTNSPKSLIEDIVKYALWLVERSHSVSRSIAVGFFQFVLKYRIFVDFFDQNDGLHKFMNQLSMMDIDNFQWFPTSDDLNYKRQFLKNIFHTLRVYFFTHLVVKTQKILKSSIGSNCDSTLRSRLLEIDLSDHQTTYDRSSYHDLWMEHKNVLLELMPVKHSWEPVENFIRLDGYRILMDFLCLHLDDIRDDNVARHVCEILMVCSLMPKFQLFFSDKIPASEQIGNVMTGMKLLLLAVSTTDRNKEGREVFIHTALLNVIINCVCGPIKRPVGKDKSGDSSKSTSQKDLSNTSVTESAKKKNLDEEILHKMWSLIRHSNGVIILIDLLTGKTTVKSVYADSVRALACQALLGLSRCETIRQIMVKLPIFTDGTLYSLMKAPVVQERQKEHVTFSKSCFQLMKNVVGSDAKLDPNIDMETTLEDLKRAEIIANTKIDFNEQQLLQLMHKHFVQKGLHKTALALLEEANIRPLEDETKRGDDFEFMSPMRKNKTAIGLATDGGCELTPVSNPISALATPKSLKLNRTRSVGSAVKGRSLGCVTPGASGKSSEKLFEDGPSSSAATEKISLDKIVKEYFRKQHALCKNPVSLCPPFDFHKPHQCPVEKSCQMESNLTWRVQQRQFDSKYNGPRALRQSRHYMYSKIRCDQRFKSFCERSNFVPFCTKFANKYMYCGTEMGELLVFDYRTGIVKSHHDLNLHGQVCGLEVKNDLLIVQSPIDGALNCSLWKTKIDVPQYDPERLMEFAENTSVMFSLKYRERALGTESSTAYLWDIEKSEVVRQFNSDDSNNYQNNVAVFHPDDNLILNDGVLWDTRTNIVLYKFDKFQELNNGVFHPNGRQIVLGSEIWDLNTFKLLKSVPELANAKTVFNSIGDCLFALYQITDEQQRLDHEDYLPVYHSSFRTFDGYDYSPIQTFDVKKKIYDISIDQKCNYISLVESHKSFRRIFNGYEIGRGQDDDTDDDDDEDDDGDSDEDDLDGFGHDWHDSDSETTDSFTVGDFSLVGSEDSEGYSFTDESEPMEGSEYEDDEEDSDEEDTDDVSFQFIDAGYDHYDSNDDDDEDDDTDDDDDNTLYSLHD